MMFAEPLAKSRSDAMVNDANGERGRALGPYPTLVLFLVPVMILEPVKPVGAYLIATGHWLPGLTDRHR
jgi:hypothetical protein